MNNGWKKIEEMDKTDYQFVLVYEDGAMRARLWNPRGYWEHSSGMSRVAPHHTCANPTHFMELPDPPEE